MQITHKIVKKATKTEVISGVKEFLERSRRNGKKIFAVLIIFSALLFYFGPNICDKIPTWDQIYAATGLELEEGSGVCHEPLTVSFLNVGQGDSAFICTENFKAIIDFGDPGNEQTILSTLDRYGVKNLDTVFVTHPHTDHFGSMDGVLSKMKTDKFITPKIALGTDSEYKYFISEYDKINSNVGEYIAAERGYKIEKLDERTGLKLILEVLAPIHKADDPNDMSLVIKLTFGETSFLFTGDAETFEEYTLLSKDYENKTSTLKSDLLKVGHHGSNSSTCDDFLNAVNPKFAVISVGKDNDYGHPHEETLRKLEDRKIKIYRTDEDGTIIFSSDGTEIARFS